MATRNPNLAVHNTSSPTKSIRFQIEQASAFPEGYAERAKLVYKYAERYRWTPNKTMDMLKNP
jgi:hypothetical protein